MCNRYSSTKNEVSLNLRKAVHQFLLAMRPNIAPTQKAPVLLMDNDAPVMRDLVWGWSSQHGPVTNARAETAAFKMFKDALRTRRCLVPADGFYEWKAMSDGKQPFRFVKRNGAGFWFAGLWENEQFTIMTAPARGCVAELHDRMPIILNESVLEWWLGNEAIEGKELIERATSPDDMECYPVTRRMSNSRYTSPDCIEKISLEEKQLGLSL
jgi:putative SOS response-associated peptidase YedK